jgi:predicted nucleotidyltransferase
MQTPLEEALTRVLASRPRVVYALLFGSRARGDATAESDVDVALELSGPPLDHLELGALVSDLEAACGLPVHIVLLDEAPPSLAYRVFRDGRLLVERDRARLVERKTRAVIDYLDFRWFEEMCAGGVLAAAARGR